MFETLFNFIAPKRH